MSHFIELKDLDGKAVLVNLDHASKARFAENEDSMQVILSLDGKDEAFIVKSKSEFISDATESIFARMNQNLFHIWEILRARLH